MAEAGFRNGRNGVVLALSQAGICTDFFENFIVE
jgi:hypothetical protein